MKEEEIKVESKERAERRMEEKQVMHINLISAAEMKAHTKEMRSEMDRKFVGCLMEQGLTKAEALKRVDEWAARWGSERNGY